MILPVLRVVGLFMTRVFIERQSRTRLSLAVEILPPVQHLETSAVVLSWLMGVNATRYSALRKEAIERRGERRCSYFITSDRPFGRHAVLLFSMPGKLQRMRLSLWSPSSAFMAIQSENARYL